MDDKEKEIIAVIGIIDFNDPFFVYLNEEQKEEMKNAYEKNISTPITFFDRKGKVLFYALFDVADVYKNGLHIRLLIGNFLTWKNFLKEYFEGLAKYFNMKKVTFPNHHLITKVFAKDNGYFMNEYGDFEKRVA